MSDLAREPQLAGTVTLYDIDYEAALQNEKIGNRLKDREDVKGKWQYRADKSLESALKGADFVVISILPGTFDEMASDVHAPENMGFINLLGIQLAQGDLLGG